MTDQIQYRPYERSDEFGLVSLFRAVYGDRYESRTSAWRYMQRPLRRAFTTIAESNGLLVGAQPSHEVIVQVNGQEMPGALLLDAMTHPEYRRRGIFAGAVEHLRRHCHEQGVRLLLTTPNVHSARCFERLPSWQSLGVLNPWVFPVDSLGLATTVPGLRWLARPLNSKKRRRPRGRPSEPRTQVLDELSVSVSPLWQVHALTRW
jgi:GNAT superfamily N-acetyltransferase